MKMKRRFDLGSCQTVNYFKIPLAVSRSFWISYSIQLIHPKLEQFLHKRENAQRRSGRKVFSLLGFYLVKASTSHLKYDPTEDLTRALNNYAEVLMRLPVSQLSLLAN